MVSAYGYKGKRVGILSISRPSTTDIRELEALVSAGVSACRVGVIRKRVAALSKALMADLTAPIKEQLARGEGDKAR